MIAVEPIDTPNDQHIGQLADLMRLLADPAATARRISELQAAAKTAADAIAEAKQVQEQARADRTKAKDDIAAAKAKHKAALDDERATFDAELRTSRGAMLLREAALNKDEEYWKQAKAELDALKADLQRRRDAVLAATK